MGMRFGSTSDEPDEISEKHRAMIAEYRAHTLTDEDIRRQDMEDRGPALEDIDWHEIPVGTTT